VDKTNQELREELEKLKSDNITMLEREALLKELEKQKEIKRKNSMLTKAIKFIFP